MIMRLLLHFLRIGALLLLLAPTVFAGQRQPIVVKSGPLTEGDVQGAVMSSSLCFRPTSEWASCYGVGQMVPDSLKITGIMQSGNKATVYGTFELESMPEKEVKGISHFTRSDAGEWSCPDNKTVLARPVFRGGTDVSGGKVDTGDIAGDEENNSARVRTVWDPLEGYNRGVFKFNDFFFFWVMKPTCTIYNAYLPKGFRICIANAYTNFQFPVRFVNNVLQGKITEAGSEAARFAINSTLGLAGMWDIAARDFCLTPHDQDFGQTLAYWGACPGFYIVWPVLGPSNVRDTVGMAADGATNPLSYFTLTWVNAAVKGGKIVNGASLRLREYEDWRKSALDPYVSMREAYTEHRDDKLLKKNP
jgi:phospholipid-binding lipoprotein MlaA